MRKTDKDIWIDKVMDSTAGMQQAAPVGHLFNNIEQHIAGTISYARRVPFRTVSLAAASIVLLVAANFYILGKSEKLSRTGNDKNKIETVIDYYGLDEKGVNF